MMVELLLVPLMQLVEGGALRLLDKMHNLQDHRVQVVQVVQVLVCQVLLELQVKIVVLFIIFPVVVEVVQQALQW